MKIPNTKRKKALFIVDVQNWFIIERNKYILWNIINIIKNIEYDLIVYSISYNQEWSLWYNQIWWCENTTDDDILPEILELLKSKNTIKVNKLTRSVFKCDEDLKSILKINNIQEIHITWYETNDCVFATAQESFDLWYYTFVLEEAVETRTFQPNHTKAIEILNYLCLTNNSKFVWYEKTNFIEL